MHIQTAQKPTPQHQPRPIHPPPRDIAGFCFTWGCCPMPSATCCEDKTHCCPSSLPVCDTDTGRCLPPTFADGGSSRAAAAAVSVPWATKVPARRKVPASGAGFLGKDWASRPRFIRPAEDRPLVS